MSCCSQRTSSSWPARIGLLVLGAAVLVGALNLPAQDWQVLQSVDLAASAWLRNGEAQPQLQVDEGPPALVHLVFDARGVRWSTEFSTSEPATFRLLLDWTADDDGLLFELVLDGERLSPPRDGWRPGRRRLLSDLGSRWLGAGRHLLEFVAREQPAGLAQLHLTELQLRTP